MSFGLETLLVSNVFAFLLIFTRFGTALMIMPGIGDSYVPPQVRLLFAVALSFIMTPFLAQNLPPIPQQAGLLLVLVLAEFIAGMFIGTIARVLMSALDTAGMIISMQSGYANAQIFNPALGGQGSLVGALLGTLGVVLLFTTNMHHLLLQSIAESYSLFPAGQMPATGDMAQTMSTLVNVVYKIGFQFSMPFIVVGLLIFMGFGILGRLMPQIQVFFLALPLQIIISLITLALIISAGMLFWLGRFEEIYVSLLG